MLYVVQEGSKNEEFRAFYVILIPFFLPGLSLQAVSGQEVYQVRENRTARRPGGHGEC